MKTADVQGLVLRPAHAHAVAHFLLRVSPGKGGRALKLLEQALKEAPLTTGDELPEKVLHCTVGFSYRGLEALGLPDGYLGVFARLAPAFAQGAPLRAARLGDSGASAPVRWRNGFTLDNAHVLISLHAGEDQVGRLKELKEAWRKRWTGNSALACVDLLLGERLGAPDAQKLGEWVHFGFRDGLVDHRIAGVKRSPPPAHPKTPAPEFIEHAVGEFLLGHPNNDDYNPFLLPQTPAKVRAFFHDSSFGVLRPMEQDVYRFQQAVEGWQQRAREELEQDVSVDWIKAKLCGRWPGGDVLRPGKAEPDGELRLTFEDDADGIGCPWFSHVRRMDPRGHAGTVQRGRTLLRRGMPFGPRNWEGRVDTEQRGLLGFFFCAAIEDQFEQLLGQWASGAPPGAAAGDLASDPLAGHHGDRAATALLPLGGGRSLPLSGFHAWTRTMGTVYTWHPGGQAVQRILEQDYVPDDEGGPWL